MGLGIKKKSWRSPVFFSLPTFLPPGQIVQVCPFKKGASNKTGREQLIRVFDKSNLPWKL